MKNVRMALIDLETSGLDPTVHGVLQLAAVELLLDTSTGGTGTGRWEKTGREINLHCRLRPEEMFDRFAGTVTGLTEDDVRGTANLGRHEPTYAVALFENWLRAECDPYNPVDKYWLAEWGNGFDSDFLHPWWEKATAPSPRSSERGPRFHPGNFFRRPGMNLMSVCQYLVCNTPPGKWRLEDAADRLDVDYDPERLHDALYDCQVTAEVLIASEWYRYGGER